MSKALQLLSHYALPPNQLQYCGKNSAAKSFVDCIQKGKCDRVKKETKHFIVLWPYLKTIAQATGKDPFSYEVIEAYWYGNDLLKQIKPAHYQLLLKNLKTQGVPNFLIQELKTKKPKAFVPIHLFNILHVGVGRASGAVPFNLENVNHCMIRWGKVIEFNPRDQGTWPKAKREYPGVKTPQTSPLSPLSPLPTPRPPTATISLHSLTKTKSSQFKISIKNEQYAIRYPLSSLTLGSTVTVHWKQIIQKITPKEEAQLSRWTNELLNSLQTHSST